MIFFHSNKSISLLLTFFIADISLLFVITKTISSSVQQWQLWKPSTTLSTHGTACMHLHRWFSCLFLCYATLLFMRRGRPLSLAFLYHIYASANVTFKCSSCKRIMYYCQFWILHNIWSHHGGRCSMKKVMKVSLQAGQRYALRKNLKKN